LFLTFTNNKLLLLHCFIIIIMGQAATKQQRHDDQPQSPPRRLSTKGTFDSQFTLISPQSDLSDPSRFFYRPPPTETTTAAAAAPQTQKTPADRKIFIQNVPPPAVVTEKAPLLRRKKSKTSTSSPRKRPQRAQKMKQLVISCLFQTSKQAYTATKACVQHTHEAVDKTVLPKLSSCLHATGNVLHQGAQRAGQATHQTTHMLATHATRAAQNTSHQVAQATQKAVQHVQQVLLLETRPQQDDPLVPNESDCAIVLPPVVLLQSPLSNTHDYHHNDKSPETATPLIKLDKAFAATVPAQLFSETSQLDTSDPDFAPLPSQKISNFDAGSSPRVSPLHNHQPSPDDRLSVESIEEIYQGIGEPSAQKNSIFRHKSDETLGSSKNAAVKTTNNNNNKAAVKTNNNSKTTKTSKTPPMIRHAQSNPLDYRTIALSTTRNYIPYSPSSVSSASSATSGPLVANEALSNAAFLFSPSYYQNGTQRPAHHCTISTFASRARLSTVSSRSRSAITIPISKSWDPPGQYRTNDTKHVRFSDETRLVVQRVAEVTRVSPRVTEVIAGIETKLSDLTDATKQGAARVSPTAAFLKEENPSPKSLDGSTTSSLEPSVQSEEPSVQSLVSSQSVRSSTSSQVTASSSLNSSFHWAQREENGKVVTTPKIAGRHYPKSSVQPTASPMLRFKAAKTMFANPPKKTAPSKRTPPKKFSARTPKKTLVSNLIQDLHERIQHNHEDQSEVVKPRRDTSGHQVLAPRRANLVNPSFAGKQHVTDEEDEGRLIPRTVSSAEKSEATSARDEPEEAHEAPFDEEASHMSEDVFATLARDNGDEVVEQDESIAETEASDDAFAAVMKANLYEPSPRNDDFSLRRATMGSMSTNSMYSYATQSTRSRYSLGTFGSDKENSVSLTSLHKKSMGGAPVNPRGMPGNANLCLSPTQKTPMQARKWRTLAAAAHEKKQRAALSDRNVNVL
jgi:hypothetical protein